MRWLLVMICTTPTLLAQPAETVDFSLPPREGLLLDVASNHTMTVRQEWVTANGDVSHQITTNETRIESFRHRFATVTDRGVTAITREYGTSSKTSDTRLLATYEIVSGSGVRATWPRNGEPLVEHTVQSGDWVKADIFAFRHIVPMELRSPIVPVTWGSFRPGQSWEFCPRALHRALWCTCEGNTGWVESQGRAHFEKVVATVPGGSSGRFAKIALSLRVVQRKQPAIGPTFEMTARWAGKAYYDMDRRVFVKCSGHGTWDRALLQDGGGTTRWASFATNTTGKIVPSGD